MLYLTDSLGNRVNGITLDYKELGDGPGALVTLQARAYETDTMLSGRYVSSTIYWNDGTGEILHLGVSSVSSSVSGYISLSASKRLLTGTYICELKVVNLRTPKADSARINFFVTVSSARQAYKPQNLIFGPILPRDAGYPNNSQWKFDIDADMAVLESSVKMLLLTSKGDRLMEPGYGTNVRRLLFETNISSTDSLIREEIISALAQWEPRVELAEVRSQLDPNDRSISLYMVIRSRLTRQTFETSVQYNR